MKRCLIFSLLLSAPGTRADVALLLQEPHGTFGSFNPMGHAAVYLSRVCAESPTELRRCRDGERGAVISRHGSIAGGDWLAVPPIPYFYAVERAEAVPEEADGETASRLRDAYLRNHLQALVPDTDAGPDPGGEWHYLVGAAYNRRTYVFMLETSEEADDGLIAFLNSDFGEKRFNLIYRNCADFAKDIVNFYYPKALRRSITADAGITTPKPLAKSLVQFSRRQPELGFSAFTVPQVGGSSKRSRPARGLMESMIRSKKYVIPIVIVEPWIAVGGLVAYLTGGRFNPNDHATASCGAEELEDCLCPRREDPRRGGRQPAGTAPP